nr:immunoglobulin light chain junction region [Macaca mulatta]MOX85433.1 immunoglobulin light chain junction region [Macaca mulatta]MOX85804.1 immunoglobulin light chain junction region [Macaca mulatta]MOX85921.1 immunoglobulin light chain junction region [Macaca mulatta]MOX86131.1 immunoglobulin light chain junction region [Macaca mulatta]
CLQYANDPFTF